MVPTMRCDLDHSQLRISEYLGLTSTAFNGPWYFGDHLDRQMKSYHQIYLFNAPHFRQLQLIFYDAQKDKIWQFRSENDPKITKFILFTDFYLHHTLFLFPWKARLCLNFRWCYCPHRVVEISTLAYSNSPFFIGWTSWHWPFFLFLTAGFVAPNLFLSSKTNSIIITIIQ